MTSLTVNSKVLDNIKYENIEAALNRMIDNELDKSESEMNIDFVNECVDALLTLAQEKDNRFTALVPLVSDEQFLKQLPLHNHTGFRRLNVFARAAIVAAVLASGAVTANAAYQAATGENLLGNIGSAIHEKLEDWGIIADNDHIVQFNGEDDDGDDVLEIIETNEETTTQAEPPSSAPSPVVLTTYTGIQQFNGEDDDDDETITTTKPTTTTKAYYIEQFNGEDDDEEETTEPTTVPQKQPTTVPAKVIPDNKPKSNVATFVALGVSLDGFKQHYVYGEVLDLSGLTLEKVMSDGSREPLALEDCTYTASFDMNQTADYLLRIMYQSAVLTVPFTVRPDEDTRESEIVLGDDFDYLLTDKGAYITAYHGMDENISLNTVDGEEVIAIGASVFKDKTIESITAENVVKIFDSAFENCRQLSDVYFPCAESIGNRAFAGCKTLLKASYSGTLNAIGVSAFEASAIESLTLSKGITAVPAKCCKDCTALKTVIFEGEVTVIGDRAFEDCAVLESVNGTDNITEVGSYAFSNNEKMEFDTFPNGIKNVGAHALEFCKNLTIGVLNPAIETVGDWGFAYCTKMTEATIPGAMTTVNDSAFRGTGITKLTMNEGVKTIAASAFMSTMVSEVHLPKSLIEIQTNAFYSTRLRNVYFGKYVTTISPAAFYRGSRLKFYVYENTYPLRYAKENNIQYELLENDDHIINFDGEDD